MNTAEILLKAQKAAQQWRTRRLMQEEAATRADRAMYACLRRTLRLAKRRQVQGAGSLRRLLRKVAPDLPPKAIAKYARFLLLALKAKPSRVPLRKWARGQGGINGCLRAEAKARQVRVRRASNAP